MYQSARFITLKSTTVKSLKSSDPQKYSVATPLIESSKLMYQSIPKPPIPHPRAIPGHLTRVKLRTVGNLT